MTFMPMMSASKPSTTVCNCRYKIYGDSLERVNFMLLKYTISATVTLARVTGIYDISKLYGWF